MVLVLNADNTGTRIATGTSNEMIGGASVITNVTVYPREITWSYDPNDLRTLVSKVCFRIATGSALTLPENFNWDDCLGLQTRTWNIVRTTSTRLYVLETIQYDDDTTGDGVSH